MNPDLPDDVALAATASIAARYGGVSDCYTPVGFAGPVLFGVADESIRWDSMAGASSWEYCRRSMVLKITPVLEPQRYVTRSKQAMLNADRAIGVDGDAISPSGSTADFDMLLDASAAEYAAAKHADVARARKAGAASQGIVQCA